MQCMSHLSKHSEILEMELTDQKTLHIGSVTKVEMVTRVSKIINECIESFQIKLREETRFLKLKGKYMFADLPLS